MSMTQLVLGCALGFLVAQGLIQALRRLFGGKAPAADPKGAGKSSPASYLRAFIRYAAPVGASAAFVLLGAWTIQDYLSTKSAHAPVAEAVDPVAVAAVASGSAVEIPATTGLAETGDTGAGRAGVDPYADAEFRVKHRAHGPASLTDRLVQHEELKARAELLTRVKLHAQRSQYECEAAEHADKYLKAGLDVWGFTTWQAKHFPVEGYEGASLAQCQEIQSAVDPSLMNLTSAVARSDHR